MFGPGIEDGIVGEFESRFLVETQGAGAGQLAVKIRGPRGQLLSGRWTIIVLSIFFQVKALCVFSIFRKYNKDIHTHIHI